MAKRLRRIAFIPDTHVPFEDKRAWKLMLKAMRSWAPDEIVVLGDFADMACVSSHVLDANNTRLLEVEVAAVCARRAELDSLGAKVKRFVAGNHEFRLDRYLAEKAPELTNMISVKELFELEEHGWLYTPYKEATKVGKVWVTHDCGNAGAQAHVKAMGAFQGNTVIGHTHRVSVTYSRNALGESHVGAMFGGLLNMDAIDYLHKIQTKAWQLGFGIGHQEESGVVHLQAIPIVKYRCVVDGVLYVG